MAARFSTLRLMADDLTGALDSAAAFVPVFGPLRAGTVPGGSGSYVLDTGTREVSSAEAATVVSRHAMILGPESRRLSFLKLDSLLRGHAGAELAALLSRNVFERVIIAPAMPFQGRITRGGRQHIREGRRWLPTGEDIAARLAAAGLAVRLAGAGASPGAGITLYDAASEADLDAIAAAGLAAEGATLWVGAAGLAAALAWVLGGGSQARPQLSGPLLGLIGTDHAVMRGQCARVSEHAISITLNDAGMARMISDRLAYNGAAFVSAALDARISRHDARGSIATVFAALVRQLAPPGLLFVSGGETLRGLVEPLGAQGLDVLGEIEPGAPLSRIVGGLWHGTAVLSKSGAFGAPDFLENLLNSLHID